MSEVTRMIAMGGRPLMEGFALLGFETWPDADTEDMKKLLLELLTSRQKALVLLETYLSQAPCPLLADTRVHGGNIIVTEVPPLDASQEYHPYVEKLVTKVLGNDTLENDE